MDTEARREQLLDAARSLESTARWLRSEKQIGNAMELEVFARARRAELAVLDS